MPFVLDASIAASWHFEDERSDQADVALDRLADERAVVPLHWWFEIRNVALTGERRKRATSEQTMDFMARLDRLPIDIAPQPGAAAVMTMARKHGLTFYGAAYLELAHRERIPLATLDGELARAAASEGVALIAQS